MINERAGGRYRGGDVHGAVVDEEETSTPKCVPSHYGRGTNNRVCLLNTREVSVRGNRMSVLTQGGCFVQLGG
ncbi:hypothetical protein ACFSF3_25960 [Vibrio chagasii]